MNKFIILLCFSALLSCTSKKEKVYTPAEKAKVEHLKDSIIKDIRKGTLTQVAEKVSKDDPVQVIKASLFKEEYSSSKSIRLTYKNISGKKIEAIRFYWTGVNAFGEPADMGGPIDGIGAGYTDDPLAIGKSRTSEWSIYSSDGKKVTKAWAKEVVFTDGTKWVLE
jgi:hypothetical protein